MQQESYSAPETEVLESVKDLLDTGREGVLATITTVEGSAYRRPGAKMVIPVDGDGVGSITAGCLEDEVLALAESVLADGTPRVETFDLMNDDDVWGLGVGCNGIIDILLEPITAEYRPVLDAYEANDPVGVATVLSSDSEATEQWTRVYCPAGEPRSVTGGTIAEGILDAVVEACEQARQQDVSTTLEIEGNSGTVEDASGTVEDATGTVEVFVDGISPPPTLLLFGTGHDIDPLVELGKQNGFRVTVVGYRGAAFSDDRFERADTVISTSPRDIARDVPIPENAYAVVATHNFIDDRLTIDELVTTQVEYIGLMGPRERFEEMLDAFEDEGRTLSQTELQTVYTPVGLNLGGGSPQQIATSIISEVLAVANDREPVHLTEREGPIHDRISLS